MTVAATDFIVEVGNPKAFDETVQQLGAALIELSPGVYLTNNEGYHVMRVLGDPGYVKFAVESQGYGRIVRQLDEAL